MLHSIRARLLLVSLVSLGPVAIAGVFTHRALSSQLEASRSVSTAHEVLKLLGKVDAALGRTHGAIATYVLFDDPNAMLVVASSYTAARKDLAALRRLVRDDPTQVERVRALERGLDEWEHGQGRLLTDLVQRGERPAAVRLAGASWLFLNGLGEQQAQVVASEHVRLEQRTAVYATAQRRTVFVLLLGGVAAIVVAVGAAVILGRRITRPLMNLTSSAQAVAEGDMSRRVDIATNDEIGVLGSAFNTMLRQVTERQEALTRARREAESLLAIARVVGGTNSLQEALRLICRELAQLTGADTVAAYVLDSPGAELRPLAGYHVPKDALASLMNMRVTVAEQGFRDDVVVRGRPVWSEDVSADPRFGFPVFRQFPHQSSLMLPLVLDEGVRSSSGPSAGSAPVRVSGAFYLVWWKERRRFGEPELGTLQTVGQQVGILLRNARLVEALENRASRLRTLTGLNHLVSSSLDVETVLRGIACASAELVGAPVASFWLADDARRVLELRAFSDETIGSDFVARRQRYDEGALGWVAIHRQPLSVPDVFEGEGFLDQSWWRAHGFSSFLGVPVVLDDVLLAVLSLNGTTRLQLSADDWELVGMFVTQAGVAIRNARLYAEAALHAKRLETLTRYNARLYTEAQRREREVTVLFEFTRRIAATLDLDEVLDIITQYATETLGCDGAAVYRWDPTLGALVFARSRHTGEVAAHVPRLQPGEGIAGRAFAERRPVWTNDRVGDPNVTYRADTEDALGRTARAFIGVPIVIRDDMYGVLLAHRLAPHEWGADEVRLLSQVAAPAAVAVENARLYAETQQNLAGAGLLNEVARTLHRTLDVRRRLPAALADLGRTFDAIGASVSVFNGAGAQADQVIPWGAAAYAGAGCIVPLFRQRDEPLLVADVERLGEVVPEASLSTEVRSLAAFPVRGRSRVLGVLTLLFGIRRVLSPFEQRVLAAYADQLAMALDNTALFEEAENQKTLLEHIFASTSDGILFLDRAGRIAALNRRGEELLGVSTSEVVGRPFVAYLVDALGERLRWVTPDGRSLQEIVEDLEQEASGDLEVQEPAPATLRWHASPTLDTLGARVGVTVTLRDVTREREVDLMKTEFVSAVSHELRTPLTSIKGSLHLLLHDDSRPLEATQRELLAICLNNTDRLIRLITDILDVSKIEAGGIQLALSHRDVGEFIQIAVDGIRAFADSRHVRVVTEIPASLPEVRIDLDRMVQVMTNLLSNAIKFSPPGKDVRVRADQAGWGVEIRVIDHGRGIAPSDVSRLFQKFQQLDSRTIREVGGTGLGLVICSGLLSEHGGTIRVESTLGQGATFIVTLPAAAGAPATHPRPLVPAGPGEAATGSPLVLIVDDDANTRAFLQRVLRQCDFRVDAVADGAAALGDIEAHRPDLVLLDIEMPGMIGHDVLRRLRANPATQELPVVVLTAPGDTDGRATSMTPGATEYLGKPFSADTLAQTIRTCLQRRQTTP